MRISLWGNKDLFVLEIQVHMYYYDSSKIWDRQSLKVLKWNIKFLHQPFKKVKKKTCCLLNGLTM